MDCPRSTELKKHAALVDEVEIHEQGLCCVTVKRDDDEWPSLVVVQSNALAGAGFTPGVLVVRETRTVFIGAGERVLVYALDPAARIAAEKADMGFCGPGASLSDRAPRVEEKPTAPGARLRRGGGAPARSSRLRRGSRLEFVLEEKIVGAEAGESAVRCLAASGARERRTTSHVDFVDDFCRCEVRVVEKRMPIFDETRCDRACNGVRTLRVVSRGRSRFVRAERNRRRRKTSC